MRYLERNKLSSQFLKANKKLIMEKLRENLQPVYKEFIQLYAPPKDIKDDTRSLEYDKLKWVWNIYIFPSAWSSCLLWLKLHLQGGFTPLYGGQDNGTRNDYNCSTLFVSREDRTPIERVCEVCESLNLKPCVYNAQNRCNREKN